VVGQGGRPPIGTSNIDAEVSARTEQAMAVSKYLNGLDDTEMTALRSKLSDAQGGKCFICERAMDLAVHVGTLDVDHVIPLAGDGKDDPSNMALTHASCNRSKQASDLRVARMLARFDRIREEVHHSEGRGPNLGDVLLDAGGSKYALGLDITDGSVRFSFGDLGDNTVRVVPLYTDTLSGERYFFSQVPIEYLHHDDRINPRSIGSALAKLVKEFFDGFPQLHVALGWIDTDRGPAVIKVFDGQHKAAAQALLGVKSLPVRVFVKPDPEKLLQTNTRAGTTLRQVAFDKSVQRRLGSSLFLDRVERYRADHNLDEHDESFSERDIVNYFKGQYREVKKYAIDNVRTAVVSNTDNQMVPFVEFGGRSTEKPLSYSTIEKTFLSKFIYGDVLDTAIGFQADEGTNPRLLEVDQIVRLMNLIADEILVGKVDPEIGGNRLENRVSQGEPIDHDHLRAYRLCREEVMGAWLDLVSQVIRMYFSNVGTLYEDARLFQTEFPLALWDRLRAFVRNFAAMAVWVNRELAVTAFGGKRVASYWQTVFKTGKTPDGSQVLPEPINLTEMIKD
jgi:hypothetical protein